MAYKQKLKVLLKCSEIADINQKNSEDMEIEIDRIVWNRLIDVLSAVNVSILASHGAKTRQDGTT